jgi:drug/metabolite transporter (DMT)-like permease
MSLRALPYVSLTALLFGSTLIASRFSVGQYEPLTYLTLRVLIASAGYLLILLFHPQRNFPKDLTLWRHATILGIFGTAVNLVCIVSSLQYLSAGLVAILITTSPVVTAFIAGLVLPEEKLNRNQWVGVALALSGAILLAIAGENGLPDVSPDVRGYLLVAVPVISGSIATVYARQTLKDYDPVDVTSIRIFVATLVILPLTIAFAGFDTSAVDIGGVGAVLYAALVGTFGGFFVQVYVITQFGAVPSSMVTYLIPLVAGVGGVFILRERITPLMMVGMVIIVIGILLVQRGRLPAIKPKQA